MIYELIVGSPPFYTGQRLPFTMHDMIRNDPVRFPPGPIMSADGKDFIIKLLNKNPKGRLGANEGLKDVLDHAWLKNLDKN